MQCLANVIPVVRIGYFQYLALISGSSSDGASLGFCIGEQVLPMIINPGSISRCGSALLPTAAFLGRAQAAHHT